MFKTVIENLPMVFSLLMGMGLIVLEVFLQGRGQCSSAGRGALGRKSTAAAVFEPKTKNQFPYLSGAIRGQRLFRE